MLLLLYLLNILSTDQHMLILKHGKEYKSLNKLIFFNNFSPDSWTDIFLVLPTMCFCYQVCLIRYFFVFF
jgi:hypothetical protein